MSSALSYPVSSIRGLSSPEAQALKAAGVATTAQLLATASSPARERALAVKAGVPHATVREAVNRADLQRVKGIGPATADLFEHAGVNSAKELALRNAESLRKTLAKFIDGHPDLGYRLPSPVTVASLVQKARELDSVYGDGAPSPARATKELKSAVVGWYVKNWQHLPPGAQDGFGAQMAVKAAGFTQVTDPEDNPGGHDLAAHVIFRHPDVVFPGSDRAWYVVFDRATGQHLETYDFN